MRFIANINREVVRFGIVGLVSNVVLYLLYLLFTAHGIGHKVAMTLLFTVGTLQTFFFNKRWTFSFRGFEKSIFTKYVVIYGIAYTTNLAGLVLLVDYLRFNHEIVQGIMIIALAILLFLIQKHWVFRKFK